ncbi:hypothetical protein [Glaciibacter psychrotolerans]|uniref:Uncharacterized protein n=1 Tax=Glaciibacter psychrotolerans TaxID=670054 RepID=A0A7Z0EG40_9MICO|nr:hypothetical protein [Leifsonia psychrotolerans]NYJ21041.1 hypothetical protein [Leifsonia psychrotolerans]
MGELTEGTFGDNSMLTGGILGGLAAEERMRALRQQLWLLTEVRGQIETRAHCLRIGVTGAPGYAWCSVAERGYANSLNGLWSDLLGIARQLDDACGTVRALIARAGAAG